MGVIRAIVSRTIDKVKGAQKSVDENRASLDDDIQELEVEDECWITEKVQNMLRDVLEKQMEELFVRLDTIAVKLGKEVKTIKDLTSTPTKFTQDGRNVPVPLKMSNSEKNGRLSVNGENSLTGTSQIVINLILMQRKNLCV